MDGLVTVEAVLVPCFSYTCKRICISKSTKDTHMRCQPKYPWIFSDPPVKVSCFQVRLRPDTESAMLQELCHWSAAILDLPHLAQLSSSHPTHILNTDTHSLRYLELELVRI